jgi:glutathione synthase/RimK-type ligase-like ATP-grasp enzyme
VYRIHKTKELIPLDKTGVTSWAISPWEDITKEVRLVVVNGEGWLAYEKTQPVVIDRLKFFNLSVGAVAKHVELSALPELMHRLAIDATNAIGLRMAAVDIIVTESGELKVLEINSAFSLTRYAKTNAATYDEAAAFYDRLVASMFTT